MILSTIGRYRGTLLCKRFYAGEKTMNLFRLNPIKCWPRMTCLPI